MKSIKGTLMIIITMVVALVIWLTAVPTEAILALDQARHIVAGLALSGLFLVFLLSTRNKIIVRWFGGLDNVYKYHKFLAIFSIAALFVHAGLSQLLKVPGNENLGQSLAGLGLAMFAGISLITIFNKKLKYENWRMIHKLMLVAYVVGLTHTYLSSKYHLLQWNALGIWMGVTSIIGILSGVYIIFVYQKFGFKYSGIVTNINKLSSNVAEIEISLNKEIDYKNGQYIFVKIVQSGIENAPHPFSISGGDGKKIYLTIKNSGDFTEQIYNRLEIKTKVSLEGPYGHMDFDMGNRNQIWIAGGIGITPFIAYLKGNEGSKSIEMFYSYHGKNSEIYKDFLEEYQKTNTNFKVNFVDTTVASKLDFENYVLKDNTSIYMCGPAKMMDSFAKKFKSKNRKVDIVYEGFKFR